MFWIRENFFAIELYSETLSFAIFRLKDGSKIGEISNYKFLMDGFGYKQSPTRNGIYMVDGKLNAYKASI
jgi:hypothetical protein